MSSCIKKRYNASFTLQNAPFADFLEPQTPAHGSIPACDRPAPGHAGNFVDIHCVTAKTGSHRHLYVLT